MISIRTVEKYSCEGISKIENYDKAINDKTQTWQCHHKLETHNSDGERRLVDITIEELKALGMYYNRPTNELIFLSIKEHRQLHTKGKQAWMKGKHQSEEAKRKISEWRKGKHQSEETRNKISEAHKGRKLSEEHRKNCWVSIKENIGKLLMVKEFGTN